MTQQDLFDNPAPASARTSDPATSHHAARSITPDKMREIYKLWIRNLGYHGPLTDEQILDKVPAHTQSPSGIRTRRKELMAAGYIEYAGYKRRLASGLFGQVWKLTELGAHTFTTWTGLQPLVTDMKGGENEQIEKDF